jgi:hypothetical protein
MFDRTIWSSVLSVGETPNWKCPTCARGSLEPREGTWTQHETFASRDARGSADWEPDWEEHVWSAHFRCSSRKCREDVLVVGRTEAIELFDEDHGYTWETGYRPTYVEPPLTLIPRSHRLPEELQEPLRECSKLYWSNPPAAAARLRIFVERYMDYAKIPRRRKTKNGLRPIMLHMRIVEWAKKRKNVGASAPLLALKWLGNDGAHDTNIKHSDVLDALSVLDGVVASIVGDTAKVDEITKVVNRNKGGRKGARKR